MITIRSSQNFGYGEAVTAGYIHNWRIMKHQERIL